jgi:hypothetical protein
MEKLALQPECTLSRASDPARPRRPSSVALAHSWCGGYNYARQLCQLEHRRLCQKRTNKVPEQCMLLPRCVSLSQGYAVCKKNIT